jgi:hypothetical protein
MYCRRALALQILNIGKLDRFKVAVVQKIHYLDFFPLQPKIGFHEEVKNYLSLVIYLISHALCCFGVHYMAKPLSSAILKEELL